MAKRFTDSEKWKDDWYISLSNDYKIVWQWLLDNCSHAGLCKRSISLLNLMCKINISEKEMIDTMDRRVLIIDDYWFIPKFIKFQYSTLLSGKPAIISVVNELFKFNLIGIIPESFGDNYKIISKSFENHCQMIKDMVKDKDMDKVKKGGMGGNQNGKAQHGQKFDPKKEYVIFPDGSKQKLGPDQLHALGRNSLRPDEVVQGLSY